MKLTPDIVKKIKTDIALGELTQKEIGDKYNVSRSIISDIACNRRHQGVEVSISDVPPEQRQLLRLQAEVEHLKTERDTFKRQLRSEAKQNGLFYAIVEEMERRITPVAPLPSARPVYEPSGRITEHLVMHLSDGHHDQIITKNDTGGLEEYDFNISCCRAERYIDTTLKWTQETLSSQFSFPSVTILAYGDHTSGEIHGAVSRSHYRNQFNNSLAIGQLHALMFRDLAPYFDQVNVVYVPGNHGRRSNKKDYLGAHDNWDYLVAKVAELHCKGIPNINFNIPNSYVANVNIDGVGFQIFHGDDIKSSLGIPWYGLEKRRHRMMALNNMQASVPIRYYCCGHFHRPGSTTEVNGEMLINGAWPATDAYAFNALGGFTEPSQLIHGVNKEYGITWRLPVKLRSEYEHSGPRRYKVSI